VFKARESSFRRERNVCTKRTFCPWKELSHDHSSPTHDRRSESSQSISAHIKAYVACIANFARYFGKSPELLGGAQAKVSGTLDVCSDLLRFLPFQQLYLIDEITHRNCNNQSTRLQILSFAKAVR
jgi:hypothetical protein